MQYSVMSITIIKSTCRRYSLAVVTIALLLVAGCAAIRQVTYPADFIYLESSQVSGLMQSLAYSLNELDEIANEAIPTSEKTNRILAILDKIDADTAILEPGQTTPIDSALPQTSDLAGLRTNHLLLDENIDEFRSEVDRAKAQVLSDPPNFYIVGKLTGGCNACHLQR